ncbi:hypothetical protein [uncultured Duncaniella sp.]|uniref:hypothetical protein n=1 Tax=uncultured Duncaniella sp. TaxID=2768039 RepID=UPI0025A9FF7D|nr:hypothetical protein [uncultured Duncaniella sp.]
MKSSLSNYTSLLFSQYLKGRPAKTSCIIAIALASAIAGPPSAAGISSAYGGG